MRVAAEGFCALLLPALRFTAPSARTWPFSSGVLFSRPEDLSAGVLLVVVVLFGLRVVLAFLRPLSLEELLRVTLLLLAEPLLRVVLVLLPAELLFCWLLEDEARVADVLLLLEEELRVVVALFFCWELEDEDDLTADVLFEVEDELFDAELELFEDDDVLRVAVVDLELPPPRVCAAAGTLQTSAPARRAASVSLNSFIIF